MERNNNRNDNRINRYDKFPMLCNDDSRSCRLPTAVGNNVTHNDGPIRCSLMLEREVRLKV